MYVTLDLDDTLIRTQQDYDEAIRGFSNWIAACTDFSASTIAERLNEIDRKNLNKHGLNKERFPTSFKQTLEEFIDNPSEEDYRRADELASSAYRTPSEYANRGFRDGADNLLDKLAEYGVTTHLLTSGDPEIQKRKINGLNLRSRVNKISIVGMGGKEQKLSELRCDHACHEIVHIGNSKSSDVEAAINAGVRVVYIPDAEWQRTECDNSRIESDCVYMFNSIPEFANAIDQILSVHP